jgi:phosphomannomutase
LQLHTQNCLGVGASYIDRAFATAKFAPVVQVAEQQEPDPEFPTVVFPNPEEGKSALNLRSGSSDSFTNLEFQIFFNWQKSCLGLLRSLFSFSTRQTKKNSWKKLVKTSDEFVNSIETAESNDSIYIMANDPDADRLAIAERVQDK